MNSYSTSWWSLLLIYRPREDKRLSWPCWLTYSGRFTLINGYPSAAGPVQTSESSPIRDRRSITEPPNIYMYQKSLNFIDVFSCYIRAKWKLAPFNLVHPVHWLHPEENGIWHWPITAVLCYDVLVSYFHFIFCKTSHHCVILSLFYVV